MAYKRPIVLSIAGFDPTGGAGVLADTKTCEENTCLGFSVITANTIQTESSFISSNWIAIETILEQVKTLFSSYEIAFVKIGIVENLVMLNQIVACVKKLNPEVYIIWDPVISSSTGHQFLKELDDILLQSTLKSINLITPNTNEVRILSQNDDEQEAARYLAQFCSVYLKGGHSQKEIGVDYLFESGKVHQFLPNQTNYTSKHGSGCILSTAITCNLAKGMKLQDACKKSKTYLEQILGSNENLLAYHHV